MTTTKNTTLEVYIDNEKVEVERKEREDVLRIIKGYGDINTNPTPGIYKIVDISKYSYGKHKVKINVKDQQGSIIAVDETSFTRKKPKSIIWIDFPNTTIVNRNIYIKGWYLANTTNTHIEVYFDGNKIQNIETESREDVYNVYKDSYGRDTKLPGYKTTYDASGLKDGSHKITMKIVDDKNNDIISTLSKDVTLKKYDGTICLDFPSLANINKNFMISGWEMSELDNSYIKIYIDNKDISNNVVRQERQDVIDAITNYGDASVNQTPGYSAEVDINSLSEGKHTIKIDLYTRLNEKIYSYTKDIYIYKNIYNGIDISSHNNIYSWAAVKKSGIDYVIARAAVRGYGINSQGIDGNLVKDETFKNYVNQANLYGMKVGAYVFSQAITEFEGVQEVNAMIAQVEEAGGKSKVTLPLIIDTEFSGCPGRCGRADSLTREQRTRIIKTMAETIKSRGYTPMIYASTSFLNNQLDMNQLREYSVWVAHYGVDHPTYQGPYEIWQYTSNGKVSGILGNVDLNYFYKKY